MDQHELLATVTTSSVSEVVQRYLFAGMPVVLGTDESVYRQFREKLATAVHVSADDINVVGSARFGFSLSPDTFGVPFSNRSDIDIVIANAELFDSIWWVLSSWGFPWWVGRWAKEQRDWGRSRIEGIFHGWLEPELFYFWSLGRRTTPPPLRDVRVKWFEALKGLSVIPAVAGHDCQARIYRSWNHAFRYHEWSLNRVIAAKAATKE